MMEGKIKINCVAWACDWNRKIGGNMEKIVHWGELRH